MTIGPVYEQTFKVIAVDTIADTSAPTTAEIGAGTAMGRLLAIDSFTLGVSQDPVEIRTIERKFIPKRGGTWSMDPELKIFRDDETETEGWDLVVFGDTTHLVISPFGDPEATDEVWVVPIEWGQKRPMDPASNEGQAFMVKVFCHTEPVFDAVVAA